MKKSQASDKEAYAHPRSDEQPPKPALDSLDRIERILADRPPLLLLDYDSMLVTRDEETCVQPQVRDILENAQPHLRLTAIVSSRDLLDIKNHVNIDHLYYLGSQGLELSGPGQLSAQHSEAVGLLPELDRAEHQVREALEGQAAVAVKRERFAVALHYQPGDEAGAEAAREAAQDISDRHEQLSWFSGEGFIKIAPAIEWNKGEALAWLLREAGIARSEFTPIYIGSSADRDAYLELRSDGIGIQVGRAGRRGVTRYLLRDTEEVARFLQWLFEREAKR